MRVLVATTAGAGHFGPLMPFARACRDGGHEVRVAAPVSFRASVEGAGFLHEPVDDANPAEISAVFGRLMGLPLEQGDRFVVQDVFARLDARAALPGLRRLVDSWQPDVIIREAAEVASYVVAEATGTPHVLVNLGLAELDDEFLPLLEEPLDELGCRTGTAGLVNAPRWTPLPDAFDVPSSRMQGPLTRFREPAGPPPQPLPNWWRDDAPLVYCSFGTVAAALPLFPAFYRRVIELLADLPVHILLTTGAGADPVELGTLPESVHVEPFWPQRDVLPHASAAVGHGGFGTTLAALQAGVPQVLVPLFSFDQFRNASRAAAVGVGIALLDDPATRPVAGEVLQNGPAAVDGLPAAVEQALDDAALRARAGVMAGAIEALPPVSECQQLLPVAVPAQAAPAASACRAASAAPSDQASP